MISVCQHRLAILVVGALSCAAQDPERTIFRSGATLIEFNFVALDPRGKPGTDLKKDEILIDEAGKRRDIAFFRFEMNSGTEAMERLPAGDFSNRTERLPSLRRNICAIALDTINTAPVSGGFGPLQESNYQQTTRAQLLRYPHAVPANTKVALYRLENDRTTGLRDFTDDLEYPHGYFSETPAVQPQEWSQQQWRGAIFNSLGSSGLRLDARCHLGSGSSAGMVFTAIRFELTDLLFRSDGNRKSAQIEIAYVEIKPNQTYKIERRNATLGYTEANGGSVQNARNWKLDPEAQAIRIILRDKLTGRYGSVDIPIDKIHVQ